MAAYLLANIDVTDPARFAEYGKQVEKLIARLGGRYLVRGGAVTPREGTFDLKRVVILEFPDMAALKRFYEGEEYAPLIKLRQSCSKGDVVLIEGYQPIR